jgi:hypothetical protein
MASTIANITPATFTPYILGMTLVDPYEEYNKYPAYVSGGADNWKIKKTGVSEAVELYPPYVRRVPDQLTMIVDLVDANIKPCAIEFQDGSKIDALSLTPTPESLDVNSAKIINRYNTMTRWVEEHWGDDLDSISFSGSTFSFNVMLNEYGQTGLTSVFRNYSESYEFFKLLVNYYRTNGLLYQEANSYSSARDITGVTDTYDYTLVNRFLLQNPYFKVNHPMQGMIRERLYNRITFDYLTLIGYFESFDITESAESPFRFIYSILFKAEKTIWTIDV